MTATTELDSPWKDILEQYFEEFMHFFFPEVHALIDWKRGHEFLDKEFQHGGCSLKFRFPVVKLTDYLARWDELKQDPSPFSIVVRTHLKGMQTRKQPAERLRWKIRLYKALHKAQYTRQDILCLNGNPKFCFGNERSEFPKRRNAEVSGIPSSFPKQSGRGFRSGTILNLLRFIDWVLVLPQPLAQKFDKTILEYEEKKKMAYVTSFERNAIMRKSREDVAEVLSIRFKKLPKQLVKKIHSITDSAFLSKLLREAVLVESVPVFERIIEKHGEAAQDRQAA